MLDGHLWQYVTKRESRFRALLFWGGGVKSFCILEELLSFLDERF